MMNRRHFFGTFLAAPLAILAGTRLSAKSWAHFSSSNIGPAPVTGRHFEWARSSRRSEFRGYHADYRTICEYHKNADGSRVLLREYGVMGTTGTQEIGDIIDRPTATKTGNWKDKSRYTIGRITGKASESDFMSLNAGYAESLAKYPDSPTLFTFPNYYFVQTYPL